MEAILRSTKVLSLALQTETAGAIAVAPLLVALSRFQIPKCDHGVIVDVVEIGPECRDGTLFDQLPKKKPPMRYHEATDMSKKLERLTEEYGKYFDKADRDSELARMCHPMMASRARNALRKVQKDDNSKKAFETRVISQLEEFAAGMVKVPNEMDDENTSDETGLELRCKCK